MRGDEFDNVEVLAGSPRKGVKNSLDKREKDGDL